MWNTSQEESEAEVLYRKGIIGNDQYNLLRQQGALIREQQQQLLELSTVRWH